MMAAVVVATQASVLRRDLRALPSADARGSRQAEGLGGRSGCVKMLPLLCAVRSMRSILSPRDRRRRCVARRVAEDEKESRSEKNKLAEEWENFWFGEYWNQEIPV
ncbi:unnamed protein product, partial [Cladocopium goreaui]